jgi:hypothetical protein
MLGVRKPYRHRLMAGTALMMANTSFFCGTSKKVCTIGVRRRLLIARQALVEIMLELLAKAVAPAVCCYHQASDGEQKSS